MAKFSGQKWNCVLSVSNQDDIDIDLGILILRRYMRQLDNWLILCQDVGSNVYLLSPLEDNYPDIKFTEVK